MGKSGLRSLFYNAIVTVPRPRANHFSLAASIKMPDVAGSECAREREGATRFPLIRDIVTRVHVVTVRIRDEVTRYALCTHVNAAAPPSDVSAITPTMHWPSDEYRFVRKGDVDRRHCFESFFLSSFEFTYTCFFSIIFFFWTTGFRRFKILMRRAIFLG